MIKAIPLEYHDEIVDIVDKFVAFNGHLNREDWGTITTYKDSLKRLVDNKEFVYKESASAHEELDKLFEKIEEEYHWVYHLGLYGTWTRVSIHTLHDWFFNTLLGQSSETYGVFFDFKRFVDMINCHFDITEPYKPSNKIAYGWKFSLDKGVRDDGYLGTKLYLFGCIKNYLIKNGVDFGKEESLQVRKIVGLASFTEEDM